MTDQLHIPGDNYKSKDHRIKNSRLLEDGSWSGISNCRMGLLPAPPPARLVLVILITGPAAAAVALSLVLIRAARPAIAAHRDATAPILFEAAIMLGVADAATPVIALVALLIIAFRLVSAEAMVILRVSNTAAAIVAATAGFIEAI